MKNDEKRSGFREALLSYLQSTDEPLAILEDEKEGRDIPRTEKIHKERDAYRSFLSRKPVFYANSRPFRIGYRAAAILCCVGLIAFLLAASAGLPPFGESYAPAEEVYRRYVESGVAETGATNFVAGMILDYRAFDTLGESFVLFTALCCVLILLRRDRGDEYELLPYHDLRGDPILRTAAIILLPPIFTFGIYVLLAGHLSPGGGFSGGAILGAGLILLSAAMGFPTVDRFFSEKIFYAVCGIALGFYALSKAYSFFCGANGLESHIPLGTPGEIISGGLILPLNLAVGMVVAMTVFGIYCLFRRGKIGA